MDRELPDNITPQQSEGIKKDVEHHELFDSADDAAAFFVKAKDRLLDINHWQEISESIKTKFQLVDRQGHPLNRRTHKGDLVTIDIPGPATQAGEGKDWVVVDELIYDDFPDEDKRVYLHETKARIQSFIHGSVATAHFFTDESSSSFIIERDHKRLTARYHGRNEKPNAEAETLADKLRNTVVAIGAMLGFSDLQWEGLIKGFLKN